MHPGIRDTRKLVAARYVWRILMLNGGHNCVFSASNQRFSDIPSLQLLLSQRSFQLGTY